MTFEKKIMKKIYFSILKRSVVKAGLGLVFVLGAKSVSAQFTAGNITVLQVGSGTGSLTNTGNPLILKEYSPFGVPTFSMAVPSTGSTSLLQSGTATSEGCLTLSPDGKFLAFGGYVTPAGGTVSLASASATLIPRGVGLVNMAGNYVLGASSNNFFSGNNIRGAVTSGGTGNMWASGGVDGTTYFGTASTPTTVQNIKANTRAISIFNNQLYFTTQSAAGSQTLLGVYQVGNNMPTASGATITNIINTTTGSQPAQFFFDATGNTCYIADQRNAVAGGIQKWVMTGPSTYSLMYTLGTGSTNVGAFGVAVLFTSSVNIVYATTTESSSNRLIAIADLGASSTATTIATAPANTLFKGLAFSPTAMTTGINEQKNTSEEVTLFPNPTNGQLHILLPKAFSQSNLEVLDVTGKAIYTTTAADRQLSLDVAALPAGIYFVKVTSGSYSSYKKFVKD